MGAQVLTPKTCEATQHAQIVLDIRCHYLQLLLYSLLLCMRGFLLAEDRS